MLWFFLFYDVFSLSDSPLALLKHSNTSAMIDLTKVHNDLLFSVRVGLLSYERIILLSAQWAKEATHPITGKVTPEGPWLSFDYK